MLTDDLVNGDLNEDFSALSWFFVRGDFDGESFCFLLLTDGDLIREFSVATGLSSLGVGNVVS